MNPSWLPEESFLFSAFSLRPHSESSIIVLRDKKTKEGIANVEEIRLNKYLSLIHISSGTKLEMLPLEKNNGVILDGLSIRRQGQKVAPTIYMDAYYREYLDGRSLKGICDQIIECCSNTDFEEKFNADFFSDYSRLQHTVVYKLINAEKNRELLKKIPHLPFLDLAIVFYLSLIHI